MSHVVLRSPRLQFRFRVYTDTCLHFDSTLAIGALLLCLFWHVLVLSRLARLMDVWYNRMVLRWPETHNIASFLALFPMLLPRQARMRSVPLQLLLAIKEDVQHPEHG